MSELPLRTCQLLKAMGMPQDTEWYWDCLHPDALWAVSRKPFTTTTHRVAMHHWGDVLTFLAAKYNLTINIDIPIEEKVTALVEAVAEREGVTV